MDAFLEYLKSEPIIGIAVTLILAILFARMVKTFGRIYSLVILGALALLIAINTHPEWIQGLQDMMYSVGMEIRTSRVGH